MRPVCDHSKYADGECKVVGGAWHFSDPKDDVQHGVQLSNVKGAFFYCGSASGSKARYNDGLASKWSESHMQNGDTFCVNRTSEHTAKRLSFELQ